MNGILTDPLGQVGLGLLMQGMSQNPNLGAGILGGLSRADEARARAAKEKREKEMQEEYDRNLKAYQDAVSAGGQLDPMQRVSQALIASNNPDWAIKGAQMQGQGATETWFTPEVEMVDGKPIQVQYSNRGNRRVVEGSSPYVAPRMINLRDRYMAVGPGGTQTYEVGVSPEAQPDFKGQQAEQSALGTSRGKALANLPDIEFTVSEGNRVLDEILSMPGMSEAVGSGAEFNKVLARAGTDRADFIAKRNQLEGIASKIGMDSLRGLGPATDKDVQVVTNAFTAITDPNISDEMFIKEAQRFRQSLNNLLEKQRRKAGLNTVDSADMSDAELMKKYGIE